MTRFLTDENVAESVVDFLTTKGHEVRDVREAGLAGAPDDGLVQVA